MFHSSRALKGVKLCDLVKIPSPGTFSQTKQKNAKNFLRSFQVQSLLDEALLRGHIHLEAAWGNLRRMK